MATLESLSRSTDESGDDRSEFDIDRLVLVPETINLHRLDRRLWLLYLMAMK